MNVEQAKGSYYRGLMLAALGVVYGDIGTSPLYALRECFTGPHALPPAPENVLGILSITFWSMILIVCVKYLGLVCRASNKGEGGILALMALVVRDQPESHPRRRALLIMGVFGAALLYGDGMITPAISVLSAVEGLKIAAPSLDRFIVPLTTGILAGLFYVQHLGTKGVGKMFGPVMAVWFVTIALLGIKGMVLAPEVSQAFNPMLGLRFLAEHGVSGLGVLGSVFLVLTGAEALYADMGHFGLKPIRAAWFWLVFPALLLNYLGQGALLLRSPEAALNPFFSLAPSWALLPLVALATSAAVIASQALISGAFSLTHHAVQLGYLPRMAIRHTSSRERGQIYVPRVNWALMAACIALVCGFKSSSHLAAAYGIAVTLTMIITSVLFYFAAQKLLGWSQAAAAAVCALFLVIEIAFCLANFSKFAQGGWVPLVSATLLFIIMTTWHRGRMLVRDRLMAATLPLDEFVGILGKSSPVRVPGTAVFMTGNPNGTPVSLLHNLKHNKVLHERTVILTIQTREVAHVEAAERVEVQGLSNGLFKVTGFYGFMDEPDVITLLKSCEPAGLAFEIDNTTFFLSSETIIPSDRPGMALWRDRIFAVLSRNAQRATTFFHLPPNRVVELGMQIEV